MSDYQWIDYWAKPRVEMPTSGFVVYTDTFFGDGKDARYTMMDMSIDCPERNLMWNKAAPRCVSKFRFITEVEFLYQKKVDLYNQVNSLQKQIDQTVDQIRKTEIRLHELAMKSI